MTIFDKYKQIQKLNPSVELPWKVWCFLVGKKTSMEIFGEQISLGHDFMSLQEARESVQWLATQLGAEQIKWQK